MLLHRPAGLPFRLWELAMLHSSELDWGDFNKVEPLIRDYLDERTPLFKDLFFPDFLYLSVNEPLTRDHLSVKITVA